jgi:hypothetical protein
VSIRPQHEEQKRRESEESTKKIVKKEEPTKLSSMVEVERSCSLLLPWPRVPHLAQTNNQTDLIYAFLCTSTISQFYKIILNKNEQIVDQT